MFRRLATVGVIAAALAAGGAAVAHSALGSLPAPAAAAGVSAAQDLATTQLSNGTQGTQGTQGAQPGGRGDGDGDGFGGFGPRGRGPGSFGRGGLTVTAVSGNTINATRWGSQAVTITVSATTAYTEAGASASLSDVQKGSVIAVRGARTGTGTIAATGVTIILPRVGGVVTNASGNTLTVTGFDGATRTITVGSATRYVKAGQSAALSDVTTGTAIVAEGKANSDGSLSAVRVTIRLPQLAGQVSGVNGSSITISGRAGTSYTVTTSGSTTYLNADGTTAAATAVKSGVGIIAEGTLSSDGKTLTALRIVVLPRANGGRFGHGGFGRHGGGSFGGGSFGVGPGFGTQGAGGNGPGATVPSTTGTSSV